MRRVGNWLHELLIGDAVYSMQTELGNLIRYLAANQAAQAQQGNTLGLLTGGIHAAITAVAGFAMFVFVVLMLLLLAAVTYAQVIWAQIALAILIILGPIFIPFLVFDPLSFLFWGWFRAMITYSLYAVIAGAVLRVFSAVGISYITSLGNANLDIESFIDVGLWMIAVVPLVRRRDAGKPQVRRTRFDARHQHRSSRERPHGNGNHGGNGCGHRRRGGGKGESRRNQMSEPGTKAKDAGAEYAEIWGRGHPLQPSIYG